VRLIERRNPSRWQAAIAAGALDPDQAHVAVAVQPTGQGAVAGPGGGERLGAQHMPGGVEHGGDVQVLVGIDPPMTTRLVAVMLGMSAS